MREPVRVLLLEMPHLLRGILEHAIQTHGKCELWRDKRPMCQLLADPQGAPDVVILGLSAAEDETLVPALFARWPCAQVMTVKEAGEDPAVYELRPRRRLLGHMSPPEIIEALQDAVHRSRAPLEE